MEGFLGLPSDDFIIASLVVEKAWDFKASAVAGGNEESEFEERG